MQDQAVIADWSKVTMISLIYQIATETAFNFTDIPVEFQRRD